MVFSWHRCEKKKKKEKKNRIMKTNEKISEDVGVQCNDVFY